MRHIIKKSCLSIPFAASLLIGALQQALADWDTTSNIGSGGPNLHAAVITSTSNDVYVASFDSGQGFLWKWNYSQQVWTLLPNSGFGGGGPLALFYYPGGGSVPESLFVGGVITSVGALGDAAAGVARYQIDNATWEAVSSGLQIDGT